MTAVVERLTTALASRYRIEREVGAGGMATVYLAEDLRHHRKVGLKVLRPELAAIVGAERFLKEIEVTANLQHPHILPLFDSGAADSFLYYVMPYVEGESLRVKLTREKQLPVDEAVRIATEVANALDYAHRHGVIHRDIKPENILLHDGTALVADFGIALAVQQAGGHRLTETGLSLGTPHYMSPEQATVDRELDARSDVYALGCVLYEMLTGEPPFAGPTAQAVVARLLSETPRGIRVQRHTVPQPVEAAVARALEKLPADRFGTATEFAKALTTPGDATVPSSAQPAVAPRYRWRRPLLAAGVVVLLGVAAALAVSRWRAGSQSKQDGPARVAVLLFQNLGGEDDAYFADGLTQDVSIQLSKVGAFRVTAHGSASRFRSREADYRAAAAALGADYLVDGSVRRAAERIRVVVNLVDPASGDQLWAEEYNRDLSAADIFDLQRDVARQVAIALNAALGPDTLRSLTGPATSSLPAYTAYLRGRHFWNRRTEEGLRLAFDQFAHAIVLDSSYALAYAGLADAYLLQGWYGSLPPAETYAKARAAALRAVALDSTSAEAQASLGLLIQQSDWDWAGAEAAYRRAIALNSDYPTAHQWYGGLLVTLSRLDEGLAEYRRAAELDPLSLPIGSNVAEGLLHIGQLDHAASQARGTLELDSTFAPARRTLGRVYLEMGRVSDALAELEPLEGPESRATLALAFGRAGRRDRAIQVLEALRVEARQTWISPVILATAALALGDHEVVVGYLEQAAEQRDPRLAYASLQFPHWNPVRGHPRFVALMRRMGLDPAGHEPVR